MSERKKTIRSQESGGEVQFLGSLVSISHFFAICAEMPCFLGLKSLGKLCNSGKGKATSSEKTSNRGSYKRRLVVEDVSFPGSPSPAHRRATVTHLLYLPPDVRCTVEHLLSNLDPLGK